MSLFRRKKAATTQPASTKPVAPGPCPATPYKHSHPGHDFADLTQAGNIKGRTCNWCGYTMWFDWPRKPEPRPVDWDTEFAKLETPDVG